MRRITWIERMSNEDAFSFFNRVCPKPARKDTDTQGVSSFGRIRKRNIPRKREQNIAIDIAYKSFNVKFGWKKWSSTSDKCGKNTLIE